MQPDHVDIDRSFFIGQRALELMKTYGSSADPRSYEVWYTYVSGHKPAMNEAIKKITAEHGSLNRNDIEKLYDEHLSAQRAARDTEKASILMLGEIEQVMEMIDTALGSTARYGKSLQAFSNDLTGPLRSHGGIRELIATVVPRRASGHRHQPATRSQAEEDARRNRNPARDLECVRVEAVTDPVTGISNRKHFQDMLHKSAEIADAQHSPSR